jgi:hypothetical protein
MGAKNDTLDQVFTLPECDSVFYTSIAQHFKGTMIICNVGPE